MKKIIPIVMILLLCPILSYASVKPLEYKASVTESASQTGKYIEFPFVKEYTDGRFDISIQFAKTKVFGGECLVYKLQLTNLGEEVFYYEADGEYIQPIVINVSSEENEYTAQSYYSSDGTLYSTDMNYNRIRAIEPGKSICVIQRCVINDLTAATAANFRVYLKEDLNFNLENLTVDYSEYKTQGDWSFTFPLEIKEAK